MEICVDVLSGEIAGREILVSLITEDGDALGDH